MLMASITQLARARYLGCIAYMFYWGKCSLLGSELCVRCMCMEHIKESSSQWFDQIFIKMTLKHPSWSTVHIKSITITQVQQFLWTGASPAWPSPLTKVIPVTSKLLYSTSTHSSHPNPEAEVHEPVTAEAHSPFLEGTPVVGCQL